MTRFRHRHGTVITAFMGIVFLGSPAIKAKTHTSRKPPSSFKGQLPYAGKIVKGGINIDRAHAATILKRIQSNCRIIGKHPFYSTNARRRRGSSQADSVMDLIGETQSLISEMKRMSLGRSEFGPYVRAANEDFYLAQIRTVTKELNNATKRTSFSRSSSGPYTSNLHRVLNEMVGRFPRDFTNADVAGRAPGSLQQAQNALKSAENALRAHKFWPESSRK